MISSATRAILDRYALASRALSRSSGERLATEAGQSVEFHDFRPYQAGDELRYVDWKVYARTGRLYTRLFQAERTISLYILLDTSASMSLGHKLRYARILAQLLSYVAQRDSLAQVFLLNGLHTLAVQGRAKINETWAFIDDAPLLKKEDPTPVEGIKRFALQGRLAGGAGLALVVSDLFDESSLRPALVALKARGLDASFLHIMAEEDLNPEEAQLEVVDVETGDTLEVSVAEVRAYKRAVHQFIERSRSAILQAGFRHLLLKSADEPAEALERRAFAALIKAGVLIKR